MGTVIVFPVRLSAPKEWISSRGWGLIEHESPERVESLQRTSHGQRVVDFGCWSRATHVVFCGRTKSDVVRERDRCGPEHEPAAETEPLYTDSEQLEGHNPVELLNLSVPCQYSQVSVSCCEFL